MLLQYLSLGCLLLSLFVIPTGSIAHVLPTQGQIWPIGEKDFLAFIKAQWGLLQANGRLRQEGAFMQARLKNRLERPVPLDLTTALYTRTFFYDPTQVVLHTIYDQAGRVLVKKGTHFNPLERLPSYYPRLYFINADDPHEVAWLQMRLHLKRADLLPQTTKIILVGGNLPRTAQALGQRLYFDVGGHLTGQLGIRHHPAEVTRQGLRLFIHEFSQQEINRVALLAQFTHRPTDRH